MIYGNKFCLSVIVVKNANKFKKGVCAGPETPIFESKVSPVYDDIQYINIIPNNTSLTGTKVHFCSESSFFIKMQ